MTLRVGWDFARFDVPRMIIRGTSNRAKSHPTRRVTIYAGQGLAKSAHDSKPHLRQNRRSHLRQNRRPHLRQNRRPASVSAATRGGCPPVRIVNMQDTSMRAAVRPHARHCGTTHATHRRYAPTGVAAARKDGQRPRRGSLSRGKGAFGAQVDLRSEAKDFKDRFCVEAECVASDGGGWHLGRAVYGCEVRRLLHQVAVDLKTKTRLRTSTRSGVVSLLGSL